MKNRKNTQKSDSDSKVQSETDEMFVKLAPAGNQAFQGVLRKLLKGEIIPGKIIRESILSNELKLNHCAVREALNQLVGLEILEYVPYCGYRLRRYTLYDNMEWYELRLCTEIHAINQIIGYPQSDLLIKELRNILENEQHSLQAGNMHDFSQCDSLFHYKIVTATNNRLIDSIYQRNLLRYLCNDASLKNYIEAISHESISYIITPDERCLEIHKMHCRILDAICNSDFDMAARLERCHLEENYRRLRTYLLEKGRSSEECTDTPRLNLLGPVIDHLMEKKDFV